MRASKWGLVSRLSGPVPIAAVDFGRSPAERGWGGISLPSMPLDGGRFVVTAQGQTKEVLSYVLALVLLAALGGLVAWTLRARGGRYLGRRGQKLPTTSSTKDPT